MTYQQRRIQAAWQRMEAAHQEYVDRARDDDRVLEDDDASFPTEEEHQAITERIGKVAAVGGDYWHRNALRRFNDVMLNVTEVVTEGGWTGRNLQFLDFNLKLLPLRIMPVSCRIIPLRRTHYHTPGRRTSRSHGGGGGARSPGSSNDGGDADGDPDG